MCVLSHVRPFVTPWIVATSLLCKEIQPVHPKGDQSWVFIGGTDVEAETPILWPPDAKSWLIWKDPDAGKDWGQEKGTTEDAMVRWHHRFNGHGFGWTLGVGDGQGGLACCGSWGRKESDMTERLNWTEPPLPMEFSRQEYWSGLPFPFPGDLPDPGIESVSLASPTLAGRFFTTVTPGKPQNSHRWWIN